MQKISKGSTSRNQVDLNWQRFGLGSEEPAVAARSGNSTNGFVYLGNEYDYGAGGHQASGANELFAEEQV